MKVIILTVVGLLAAAPCGAETGVSFEAALGRVRGRVLKTQAKQLETRQSSLAERMAASVREVWELNFEAEDIRRAAAELRAGTRVRSLDIWLLTDQLDLLFWGAERQAMKVAHYRRLAKCEGNGLKVPATMLYTRILLLDIHTKLAVSEVEQAYSYLAEKAPYYQEISEMRKASVKVRRKVALLAVEGERLLAVVEDSCRKH